MSPSRRDARAADARARRAACEEWERPLLLEAGAGTGKTAVLVSRIVHWLMGPGWERAAAALARESAPPVGPAEIAARAASGVVAITFTEAAAAEMADRVAAFLAALADRGPDRRPPRELTAAADLLAREGAVERATHLLSAVDRLHVQTIHGFCRSLLAAHPAEAGVHPAFVVDAEDPAADLLFTELVEELLPPRYAAGDAAFLTLAAAGLGPAKLAEALRTLLAQGATAEELRADPLAPDRWQALLDRLAAAAGDLAVALSHLPPQGGALSKAREAQAVASLFAARAAEGADEAALEELLAAAKGAAQSLGEKLKKWSGDDLTQTEAAHLGEVRSQLAEAAGRLRRLLDHLAGLEPRLLAALRTALLPLLEEIEARRYRLGLVSFDELQRKAVRLLERYPAVARLVRGSIAQLLVDEFQDTDALQCRLVETVALAAPPGERPGLLLVGDPKQSIYGWRRADLAAYEAFARRLEERGGRVEALTVNFRSVPAILAEVERAMGPAFEPEPGLQPPFVALVACPDKAEAPGCTLADRAPVEHWLTWRAASGEAPPLSAHEATRLEARAIAADLAALRAAGGADVPAWSEIAILLRATGDLPYYLSALREAGVPYQVDSDRSFYRQREVIDAAALVRTVLDPGDQVALVALLRSPWVGVPDTALLPLWTAGFPAAMAALAGPDPQALAGLLSLVERAAAESAATDAPGPAAAPGWELALGAAAEGVAALRAGYRSLTSDRFVAALRARFPVEALAAARFLGAHRLASLRRLFDRLVDDLERAGGDPSPVLRWLRRAVAEELEEPKGLPRTTGDAVQVLTIHKAKGLDFRYVYLPQLHRGHGGDGRPDLWRGDREGGAEYSLLGIRSLGMDEVGRLALRTEEAERVRLLYVGMTRAKERLVTLGRWPGEPGGRALRRETLLHPLSEALGGYLPCEALAAGAARDPSGVRWRICGAMQAAPRVPAGTDVAAFCGDPWEARERFAARRLAAATRASRELVVAATSWLAQRGEEADLPPGERDRAAEAVATAVGTAVHRFLECLDPGSDWAAERRRMGPELRALLSRRLPAEPDRAAAEAELGQILEGLATGPLRERFDGLAGRIAARELPLVLPPPAASEAAPLAALTATVDLLYLDPQEDGLVLADHKTDRLDDDAVLARRHGPQLRLYAEGLADALALPAPPRIELWLLRHGRVLRLDGPPAPASPRRG